LLNPRDHLRIRDQQFRYPDAHCLQVFSVRKSRRDVPQCREVCPVDCIPANPDVVETKDQLFLKYRALMASTNR